MRARLHHQISTAEPVVGFDAEGWTRYLTLRGERAFVIGGRCETCAFIFERKESNFLSPTDISLRLASGDRLLDDDLIGVAGAVLSSGDYAVAEIPIEPTLTGPCHPDDYFSHESLDLFGLPAFSGVPDNPRTPYWRAGTLVLPPNSGAYAWPAVDGTRARPTNPKRFFHFLVPMEPPHHLDPDRIEHYQRQIESGARPAAFGVSILDVRAPAVTPWDKAEDSYEYAEHWCLATYLLDGHHKVEAAARSKKEIRLLSFIARGASVASEEDIDAVVQAITSA